MKALITEQAMYRPTSPLSSTRNASGLLSPTSRLSKSHHTSQSRSPKPQIQGLPRFHPANYQSSNSADSTITSTSHALLDSTPQPPISPRQQHRQIAEAQRHLYGTSRHTPSPLLSPPITSSRRQTRPLSPRLLPLGSPGPVTPLELEEADNYIALRPDIRGSLPEAAKVDLEEALQEALESNLLRSDNPRRRRDQVSRGK